MEKIHVSQFYACSKVSLACELYYICELGKNLYYKYNEQLSLDGVILTEILKKSDVWEYFRMAIDEGWVCDTSLDKMEYEITIVNPLDFNVRISNKLFTTEEVAYDNEEKSKRDGDLEYNFRTPLKSQVSFHTQTDDLCIWDINGKENSNFTINNKSINDEYICFNLVALIAYVAVERLKTGKPKNFGLNIIYSMLLIQNSFSYTYILFNNTNCFTGWCFYSLNDSVQGEVRKQLGYRAWYTLGKDRGMLNRFYTAKEKREYLKKLDIQKGDFVLFYERKALQKDNSIKEISSFKLAKLDDITKTDFKLTYFSTTRPRYHQEHEFNDNTTIVKSLYADVKPFEQLRYFTDIQDINDVGVEYMMYKERYFIMPLDGADDKIACWVTDGHRKDYIYLTQNNLIYWILMDYNYTFDLARFIMKYFPDEEPVYDIYMRGEDLDPSLYVK